MTYLSLSPSLHSTADAAIEFFRSHHGAKNFQAEIPIDPDIRYCPTLSTNTIDFHHLCLEVTDSAYSDALDANFVVECMTRFVPVRLYIITPKGLAPTTSHGIAQRARRRGVGVVELSQSGNGEIIHEALSLSLAGVRPVDPKVFPDKYRQPLSQAELSFRNGNPAKGCSMIYDEIEALSRRVAKKTYEKGLWTGGHVNLDFAKANWVPLLEAFMNRLDPARCRPLCPELKKPLVARVLGITEHRNETGHKPRNRNDLIKRDKELRTRFEDSRDLLLNLVQSVKALRV